MPFPLFPLPMAVPASLCRAPLLRSMFTPSIVFLSCPPGFTHSSLRLSFRFTPLFASLLFSSLLFCSLLFSLFSPFAFSLFVSLPNSDSFLPLRAPYLYSTFARLACLVCLAASLAYPSCLPCLLACLPASLPVRVVFLSIPLCALLATPPLSAEWYVPTLVYYTEHTNERLLPLHPIEDHAALPAGLRAPLYSCADTSPFSSYPSLRALRFVLSFFLCFSHYSLSPLRERRNDPLARALILRLLLL